MLLCHRKSSAKERKRIKKHFKITDDVSKILYTRPRMRNVCVCLFFHRLTGSLLLLLLLFSFEWFFPRWSTAECVVVRFFSISYINIFFYLYIKQRSFNSSYSLLIVLGFILKFSSIWCRYIGCAGSVSYVSVKFLYLVIVDDEHLNTNTRVSSTTTELYRRPVKKILTLLFLL